MSIDSIVRLAAANIVAENISGYETDEIVAEVLAGLKSIKGSNGWTTLDKDIEIHIQDNQILAVLLESGNGMVDVSVPIKLVAGPVIRKKK